LQKKPFIEFSEVILGCYTKIQSTVMTMYRIFAKTYSE